MATASQVFKDNMIERQRAQAELARIGRLTTMGELVASIGHEINQPLAAISANGEAALRWLNRDPPDLDELRNAVSGIKQDATRAGQIIENIRALAKKTEPQSGRFDINEAIEEILQLIRGELSQQGVVLHTELSGRDRMVLGDRVQLQQVMLNLIMNGIEAMSGVTDRPKLLIISSERREAGGTSCGQGHGCGDRSGCSRPDVQVLLHHETQWHWDGTINLPIDNRSTWRAFLGITQYASRRYLPVYVAKRWKRGGSTQARTSSFFIASVSAQQTPDEVPQRQPPSGCEQTLKERSSLTSAAPAP